MEIRQLRTFLAVANARSFLGAEETLFISRQAISKTINQLESELNTHLFVRNQSGAMMTPAGIYFYSRAAALVANFDRLSEEMRNISRSYRPKITLCVALGLYSIYADRLRSYAEARESELELNVRARLDTDCDTAMTDRKADAVISFTPQSSHTSDSVPVVESPLVLLSPREIYSRTHGLDELFERPRLLYTGGRDKCLWLPDDPRPNDYCSSDFDYLFSLLRKGCGVMPLPKALVPDYMDFAEVTPFPQEWPPCRFYFSTLYSSYYDALTYSLLDDIRDELFYRKRDRR